MTARKLFWLLCGGLLVSCLLLAGATYTITKLLHVKAAQLAANKAQIVQLTAKQSGLVQAKADLAKYASLDATVQAIVPQDKDQAEAVRQITNIAAANQVTLTSIAFPTSSLGVITTPTSASLPSVTTPTALSTAKSALSQLTPVLHIPGVYNLQITLSNNASSTVSFDQLEAFLQGLENNRRTAAVSSLSIQPQNNNPDKLIFTLIINDYVKPS